MEDKSVEQKIRLPRVISVWSTTAYIVCTIIGSGIFVSPKGVLQYTVSPGMALVTWLVTGVVEMLVAFCYAELALTFPKAGADYTYITEGFGQLAGFVYIWVQVVFMEGCGKAISALTFSTYFCQIFYPATCSPPDLLKKLVAGLAFSGLVAMHCFGSKLAVRVSDLFTVAKICGILVVIASGIAHVASGHTDNFSHLMDDSSTQPGSYALAFYTASWAYGGVQSSMNIVEEIKQPIRRNIIVSILVSQITVITLYCLANVAYIAVLTPGEILSSDAVAMTMAEKVFSGIFWIMPFFVCCSTFGNMNNSIMTASRMIFAASRQRQLPRPLALLNAKYLTPIPIFAMNVTLALAFLCTNGMYDLIVYTSYTHALFTFLSLTILIMLRFTKPDLDRPFKLPLVIPVMCLIVWTLLLVLPIYQDLYSTGICFAFLASGIPVYFFTRMKKKPEVLMAFEFRATILMQKLCYALPEDAVEHEE